LNRAGTATLAARSSHRRAVHVAFDVDSATRLQALLHRSPRTFGYPTNVRTFRLGGDGVLRRADRDPRQ
jgi:hypothetical protein